MNGTNWFMRNFDGWKGTKGVGVKVKERFGATKTIIVTFENVSIATIDATTNGAQGSLKVYSLPQGLFSYVGGTTNLTIARVGTNLTANSAVVAGVGTAVAGVDPTLTGTEQDLIPSTAATLVAGASPVKGKSVTATAAVFDGTATAKDVYLNFATVDAGSTGNDALLVNGTITLVFTYLGDN